ncbi:MAG: hypothetical protein K2P51_01810 [Rhabdochlamydiaceae bacterium]|nr:hypothetical protein [Rhabdochlamydiaceae bacterium]
MAVSSSPVSSGVESPVFRAHLDKDPLVQQISQGVSSALKTTEFSASKDALESVWMTLVEKGVVELVDSDPKVRPYVNLQRIVEHILSEKLRRGEICNLSGVIHTPMPATPLCITDDAIPEGVVHPSVAVDSNSMSTVKARATSVRDFLREGGDLYIVYPNAEGANKRPQEALDIYQAEQAHYPVHLFDCPLKSRSIESELVGAYYLFNDTQGKQFAFAIRMSQANSPQENIQFGMWFGEASQPEIKEWISHVVSHVQPLSDRVLPDIR